MPWNVLRLWVGSAVSLSGAAILLSRPSDPGALIGKRPRRRYGAAQERAGVLLQLRDVPCDGLRRVRCHALRAQRQGADTTAHGFAGAPLAGRAEVGVGPAHGPAQAPRPRACSPPHRTAAPAPRCATRACSADGRPSSHRWRPGARRCRSSASRNSFSKDEDQRCCSSSATSALCLAPPGAPPSAAARGVRARRPAPVR